MAAHKIYAVFHVSGCFKFKVTFHNVFSFKWVLISKPKKIYDHFWQQNMLNCLNSIMRWLANVTILLFTWTFETWYFCFSRKAKGIQHNPLVFLKTYRRCAFSSLLEINGIKLNIWGIMEEEWFFFKTLIIISLMNKN